jgi:hypothetical protein
MNRHEIEHWFEGHPEAVHADPRQLLDRCEREVRGHVAHEAWAHARRIAEERLHDWEASFGLPASDAFVAREVCQEMARELRRRAPVVRDDAPRLSAGVLGALEPAAREILMEWSHELAGREERATWREVIKFTNHVGRDLVRDGGWSNEPRWDFEHSYSRTAERVTRLLIHEYEQRELGRSVCDDIE